MLLMIEALLLISAALQDRAAVADGKTLPLDMALNSVDDLYVGCKKNMAYRVETELLKNELSNSDFKEAWQKAEEDHKPPEDNLKEIHSVAIYAYSDIDLHDIFNKAVRSGKEKYKNKTYSWYSLQFLLTEAIQILKETQNGCKSTYRGTRNTFDQNVLNNQVRFGQFASSSFDQTQAEEFGTKSCFEITTCEGANVTKYSALPIEKEVLIPPYEVFNVTEVKTRNVQEDLWCETVFVLESTGVKSDLNCDLFKKPVKSITNRSRSYYFRRLQNRSHLKFRSHLRRRVKLLSPIE